MCGLTGIFDLNKSRPADDIQAVVMEMTRTLVHRGPDDDGVWVDASAGLGLGFRRLAIVDLSPQGHQPMVSRDHRYVLAFNGEIYNFEELRAELAADGSGEAYRGRSDTEVMLRAFAKWGVMEATTRFVGMFAFALWDRNERVLHLGRDRFGEKPLYYGWVGSTFVFGSELKALAAHPDFAPEIDRDVLALFLRHSYIPAPWSIYRGIRKLPPGTIVGVRASDGTGAMNEPRPYWTARDAAKRGMSDPFAGTEHDAVDELDSLLRGVIRNQMVADVPLGAFLSGGTDSSTVVAIMQSLSSKPVRTFTIGFDEEQFNEARHAKNVADHLGTDHTELYVRPADAMQVIPRLPALYDEPFADSSQIPTFLVSELASRHVTVSLSGDGGDEFFAGYSWYFNSHQLWRKIGWMPQRLRAALGGAMSLVSTDSWDRLLGGMSAAIPRRLRPFASGDKVSKFAHILARGSSPEGVYRMLVSRWNGDSSVVLSTSGRKATGLDADGLDDDAHPIHRLMYADTMSYLPDNILAKVDRASMAVSLESRAPLLDHRVFELAWRLPMSIKTHDGKGKWPLRQVLHRYVPPEIVDRPKMGFCVPIDSWLRGPLREWGGDLLNEHRLHREGYLDPAPISRKWREHVDGGRNWQHHLWNVLMFQSWLDSQSVAKCVSW